MLALTRIGPPRVLRGTLPPLGGPLHNALLQVWHACEGNSLSRWWVCARSRAHGIVTAIETVGTSMTLPSTVGTVRVEASARQRTTQEWGSTVCRVA